MGKNLKPNRRQEILLMFLGAGEPKEVDPIRIMKGLFLLAMEAPLPWLPRDARYEFEPYIYGPCSFQIYSDLDDLQSTGYIRATEAPGRSWKYYSLTAKGVDLVHRLMRDTNPELAKYLGTIRGFVSKLSFRQLLATIYRQYPQYAEKSVFRY